MAIRFLSTEQEWNTPGVQEVWRRLLTASVGPGAIFQSPEWINNKLTTKREEVRVAAVCNQEKITGIAPLLFAAQEFNLKLGRLRLKTVQLLGGEGLMQEESYEGVFESIFHTFDVDAIHFKLMPIESECWNAVRKSHAGYVHIQDRLKLHLVHLPETFDQYFSRFGSKHRKNLKHSMKILQELGELRLKRISSPEDVPEFLRVGSEVAGASWQAKKASYLIKDTPDWSTHLRDLGTRGLLRSYLLWCGSRACAYVLGYQGGGYYHYSFAGYDQSMARVSLGTVMLLLIIEDLILYDNPGKLHFGEGEDEYKRRFGSEGMEVANVMLLRQSMKGRLATAALEAYRFSRELGRHYKSGSGNE